MGIFADWAMKYFEAGVPVIPLQGKVPVVRDWQIWSTKEQTEDEVEDLVRRFPSANIGAVLGRWASAVDVDTDDERIIRAAPYSPLIRRGQKGGVYLFAPNAQLSIPGSKVPVEFLNHGRQIVLPPSIHPDTGNAYTWIGTEDFQHTHSDALPTLMAAQFENLQRLCVKFGIVVKQRERVASGGEAVHLSDAGRNNRLTSIAYAMACDDVPLDEGAERLLEMDMKEHEVPWFTDRSEPHRGRNPKEHARRFYERALKKAEIKGDRRGPLTINLSPTAVSTPLPVAEIEGPPKPRGLIRLFQNYCNQKAFGNQDALGLGGGLALMAALASNRFRTQAGTFAVWPNLYIMNLGHSGFGKEVSQQALDDLLMETGLLGAATYKSGSSIVMNLPEQPMRLDVIDECAMILKAMGSQEDYKADIVDVLSTLYSKSSSFFHGFSSKGDGKNFGACWNPCVNILGATTPAGFRSSVSKDMAAKGLLPRFLIFSQQDIGEFKGDQDPVRTEELLAEMRRLVRRILATPCREHANTVQANLLQTAPGDMRRFDPEVIPMSDGAQRALKDLQRRYFYEGKLDPERFESAFKNRFAQHVAKLSLLDALGLGLAEIGVDSVEWAHAVVEWQWRTVKPLYELASAANAHEKEVLGILQWLQAERSATRSQLLRRFTSIPKFKLEDMLKQLEDGGCVFKTKTPSTGGRPAIVYEFVKALNSKD